MSADEFHGTEYYANEHNVQAHNSRHDLFSLARAEHGWRDIEANFLWQLPGIPVQNRDDAAAWVTVLRFRVVVTSWYYYRNDPGNPRARVLCCCSTRAPA
jgi:hypothetical protein